MAEKGIAQRLLPTKLGLEDVVSSKEEPEVSSMNLGE